MRYVKDGFLLMNFAIPVGGDWQAIESLSVYRFRHTCRHIWQNPQGRFMGLDCVWDRFLSSLAILPTFITQVMVRG